jgi:hypothetical protein
VEIQELVENEQQGKDDKGLQIEGMVEQEVRKMNSF